MRMAPDIIAISETWLDPTKLNKIRISGYTFMHSCFKHHKGNCKSLAGGVGCYIKNIMQCTEYTQSLDLNSTDSENLWLKISLKNGKEIVLGVLYRHPKADIHDFQKKLNESICKLNNLKLKFYVCGDINIDLLQYSTNIKIQNYFDSLVSLGCSSMVNILTRISTTCSTLLDHLYTNDVEKNTTRHVLDYDVSDHLLVFFSINSSPARNQTTSVKFRDMQQFDEEAFLNDLAIVYSTFEVGPNNCCTSSQVSFQNFIHIFHNILNKTAPMKNLSRREKQFKLKLLITSAIKNSIKTKINFTG